MQFIVRGVPQEIADEVRRTRLSPGYGHPAHLEIAAWHRSVSLLPAALRPGPRSAAAVHLSAATAGGRQPHGAGPVFIHAEHCGAYDRAGFSRRAALVAAGIRGACLRQPRDGDFSAPRCVRRGPDQGAVRRSLCAVAARAPRGSGLLHRADRASDLERIIYAIAAAAHSVRRLRSARVLERLAQLLRRCRRLRCRPGRGNRRARAPRKRTEVIAGNARQRAALALGELHQAHPWHCLRELQR